MNAKVEEGLYLLLDSLMDWYFDQREARNEPEEEEEEAIEVERTPEGDTVVRVPYEEGEMFEKLSPLRTINSFEDTDLKPLSDLDVLALSIMLVAQEQNVVDVARGFSVPEEEAEEFAELLGGTVGMSAASAVLRAYTSVARGSECDVTLEQWANTAQHIVNWYCLVFSYKAQAKLAIDAGSLSTYLLSLFAQGAGASLLKMSDDVHEVYHKAYGEFLQATTTLAEMTFFMEDDVTTTIPLSRWSSRAPEE